MDRKAFGRCFLLIASLAAIAASGCSTVIKTTAPDDQAYLASRLALEEAAANVAASPWPKPASSTLADRLAGLPARDNKISRDDAIDAYAAKLAAANDGGATLIADAARNLNAASALKAVAETICDSSGSRLSDVALLEDAIADLRQTRLIYVSTLRRLDGGKDDVEHLKKDFDRAIKDLGAVADDLAANAMKQRSSNFAAPVSANQLTGAL